MDDHIYAKFPTIQRSKTTVFGSGVSGSTQSSRPLGPALPEPRFIRTHLLYEDGSETSRGSFTPGETSFLAPFPASHQKLAVYIEDIRLAHRPAPPALADRDARRTQLPRKTVLSKRSKRKRRVKGRKVTEQKRPRHNSPNQEPRNNVPRTRNVPLKSVFSARSNNSNRHHPSPERRHNVQNEQNLVRKAPAKSTRFAAMSTPSTNRHRSPERDMLAFQSPSVSDRHGTDVGPVAQRGRKTIVIRPSPPTTPTPPPPDRHNNALALDEIAHGIARLDPPLARYSTGSNTLFLSRNLRDGWAEKVRIWDKGGTPTQAETHNAMSGQLTAREERFKAAVFNAIGQASSAMSDVTKAPLPRTFCLKLKGFDLNPLAKVGLPSSAQIAATLYIHNPSSDPISFYLGSFAVEIPQSTLNFFEAPYRIPPRRIPPAKNSEATDNSSNEITPWFIRVGEDEENLTLRALVLPGGIAYMDLLLYDFALESMNLQGVSLTWSAANATQVYARVEIAGPNAGPKGFSATNQRVRLVWLRDESPDRSHARPGVHTDLQPPAFLNVDVQWGVDSAAAFIRPRISRAPSQPRPAPPASTKLIYRLSLQGGEHVLEVERLTWACVLCSVCAPFPNQHVLRVHMRRAHPQVETIFSKKKQDFVTGQDKFDVKLILPPEAIVLSDEEDEEEVTVMQTVAPSTRIGALLAASDEGTIQQVNMEATEAAPSTPPSVSNLVKEEEDYDENWQTNNMNLLPISRAHSHSPTPALDSPVRQRRGYDPSSQTSPTHPNRSTPAPESFTGVYSSRIRNERRIYDVLRELPMRYGVLNGQIVANEEEMFAEDYVFEERGDHGIISEEARLMGALWSRWVVTEKNKFIANSSECLIRFAHSFYLDVIIDYVGYRYFVRFMVEMASRGRIKSKTVAALCKKYKAREQELTEIRQADGEQ